MTETTPHIEIFPLSDWMTNCFVVHAARKDEDLAGRPCWLVDAGYDPQPMLDYIDAKGLVPEQLVLTHAHLDHIGGVPEVRAKYPDLPILVHESETEFLTDPQLNLSGFMTAPLSVAQATGTIAHGDTLALDGIDFEVRHTPGHSPGGICLIHAASNQAIVGDTLFAGSIGRYDFPTSNGPLLIKSIREQLLTLPDDVRIFPGHGPDSTIGRERMSNPYVAQG